MMKNLETILVQNKNWKETRVLFKGECDNAVSTRARAFPQCISIQWNGFLIQQINDM